MKTIHIAIIITNILFFKFALAQINNDQTEEVIKFNQNTKVNLNTSNLNFLEPSVEKDIFFPRYINHGIIYNYRFQKNEQEEKSLDPDDIVQAIAPITIPNLIVKTILYKDAKNWSVWVNGKKLTSFNQHENKEFSIFSVSKNFVQFAMFYPDLEFFDKSLSNKLSAYEKKAEDILNTPIEVGSLDWDYSNEAETILVNKKEGILLITLEPSQSFSSNDMKIKEAFYKLENPIALKPDPQPINKEPLNTKNQIIQNAEEAIDTTKEVIDNTIK